MNIDWNNPPRWTVILGWVVLIPLLPFLWLFMVIYMNLIMPLYEKLTDKQAWNPK